MEALTTDAAPGVGRVSDTRSTYNPYQTTTDSLLHGAGSHGAVSDGVGNGADGDTPPHGTIDSVVLGPPYMHTPGGTAHDRHQNFEGYYRNIAVSHPERMYHEAVTDL